MAERLVETNFKQPPDIPWEKARTAALKRDGNRCQAHAHGVTTPCKTLGSHGFHHVHHRLPRSRGGRNDLENLVTLCTQHHHEAHHFYAESIENGLLLATTAADLEALRDDADRHRFIALKAPDVVPAVKPGGPRVEITADRLHALRESCSSSAEIAAELGVSVATVCRRMREMDVPRFPPGPRRTTT